MGTAKLYSTRGTCPRMQVGCVFVRDNRPLSVGYNGAPAGMPHCTDVGCDFYLYGEDLEGWDELMNWIRSPNDPPFPSDFDKTIKLRCRRAIHAEMNAIGYAARAGISLEGSSLYIYPVGPCRNCELLLATVGVKEVIFPSKAYNYDVSAPILKAMGIEVRTYDG